MSLPRIFKFNAYTTVSVLWSFTAPNGAVGILVLLERQFSFGVSVARDHCLLIHLGPLTVALAKGQEMTPEEYTAVCAYAAQQDDPSYKPGPWG